MSNSHFNEEQQAEMNWLNSLPDEKKCWCGWYEVGNCYNGCDSKYTEADRKKVTCFCGNYPYKPGGILHHRYGCKNSDRVTDNNLIGLS
jgi:hypothetical protein